MVLQSQEWPAEGASLAIVKPMLPRIGKAAGARRPSWGSLPCFAQEARPETQQPLLRPETQQPGLAVPAQSLTLLSLGFLICKWA